VMASDLLTHGLALVFALLALVAAAGAAVARAHFVMTMLLTATALFAGLTLMSLSQASAALTLVVMGGGVLPVLFLGAVLLSTRAVRSKRRGGGVWMVLLAGAAAGIVVWASQDIPARSPPQALPVGSPAWLGALLLAAAIVCVGLLGYGERGAFEGRSRGGAQ